MNTPLKTVKFAIFKANGHGIEFDSNGDPVMQEQRFLLRHSGIKAVLEKTESASLRELLSKLNTGTIYDVAGPILYEAMLNRPETLTQEEFTELIPAQLVDVMQAVAQLMGISLPEGAANPQAPTLELLQ